MLATQPHYTPAGGVPCVWYHLIVEEEYITHHTRRDSKGHTHTSTSHHWRTIFNEQAWVRSPGTTCTLPSFPRLDSFIFPFFSFY